MAVGPCSARRRAASTTVRGARYVNGGNRIMTGVSSRAPRRRAAMVARRVVAARSSLVPGVGERADRHRLRGLAEGRLDDDGLPELEARDPLGPDAGRLALAPELEGFEDLFRA